LCRKLCSDTRRSTPTNGQATAYGSDANDNVTERTDNIGETLTNGVYAAVAGRPGHTQPFTFDEADWLVQTRDLGADPNSPADDQRVTSRYTLTGRDVVRVLRDDRERPWWSVTTPWPSVAGPTPGRCGRSLDVEVAP
jgi:YD repeat-containing protein